MTYGPDTLSSTCLEEENNWDYNVGLDKVRGMKEEYLSVGTIDTKWEEALKHKWKVIQIK